LTQIGEKDENGAVRDPKPAPKNSNHARDE